MIPESIGHYQIIKKIASGGMGDVFRAKDERLDRVVALKILPDEVAGDQKRLRRFIQEAKAASTLSHPNVAHIYEIGEANGINFIAMECVEGNTLETKFAGRPADTSEIINVAVQLADTLAEAHAKGIIHRDIKPSNIMVNERGQIKVLDFGLAKMDRPFGDQPLSLATTQARTDPGMIMGTVFYMSPEQALGHEVDPRTDLFSLGAVLYELAAGKRPFSGPNANATIDAIVHNQPEPLLRVNPELSAELERMIFKCLRKRREERYQTARDLLADLVVLKRESAGESSPSKLKDQHAEYFMTRAAARGLFVLLQFVYLAMYLSALRWNDSMEAGISHSLGAWSGEILSIVFILIALIGIAARLYFISMVLLDHRETGVQYRKAFPLLFLGDEIWALAPFGLSLRIGEIFALACVPPLVFSPFSQRTLIRSAYNMQKSGRSSTTPGN